MLNSRGAKAQKELKDILKGGGRVAAFIGAGCSSVLNIPRWDELLIELNKEFGAFKEEKELREAIMRLDYPETASIIERYVTDKAKYLSIFQRLTSPTSCFFTSLHLKIIALFRTIITTNYDSSFEDTLNVLKNFSLNASSSLEYETKKIPNLIVAEINTIRRIYHIHGDNKGGNFVLSKDKYEEFYKEEGSGLRKFMQVILDEFSLVFIGFSFNDTFFVEFMQTTMKQQREHYAKYPERILPTHFAIMSHDIYKDSYSDLELSAKGISAELLLKEGILQATVSTDGISLYSFTSQAHEGISGLAPSIQEILIPLLKRLEDNAKKRALFQELNIQLITFPGSHYLEIESILEELHRDEPLIQDEYRP